MLQVDDFAVVRLGRRVPVQPGRADDIRADHCHAGMPPSIRAGVGYVYLVADSPVRRQGHADLERNWVGHPLPLSIPDLASDSLMVEFVDLVKARRRGLRLMASESPQRGDGSSRRVERGGRKPR